MLAITFALNDSGDANPGPDVASTQGDDVSCNELAAEYFESARLVDLYIDGTSSADELRYAEAQTKMLNAEAQLQALGCSGYLGDLAPSTTATLPTVGPPKVCSDGPTRPQAGAEAMVYVLSLDDLLDERYFGTGTHLVELRTRPSRGFVLPGVCELVEPAPIETDELAYQSAVESQLSGPDGTVRTYPWVSSRVAIYKSDADATKAAGIASDGELVAEAVRIQTWEEEKGAVLAVAEPIDPDDFEGSPFVPYSGDLAVDQARIWQVAAGGAGYGTGLTVIGVLQHGRAVSIVEVRYRDSDRSVEDAMAFVIEAGQAMVRVADANELSTATTVTGANARSAQSDIELEPDLARLPEEIARSVFVPLSATRVDRSDLVNPRPGPWIVFTFGPSDDPFEFMDEEWPRHGWTSDGPRTWESLDLTGVLWRVSVTTTNAGTSDPRGSDGSQLVRLTFERCDSC